MARKYSQCCSYLRHLTNSAKHWHRDQSMIQWQEVYIFTYRLHLLTTPGYMSGERLLVSASRYKQTEILYIIVK